MTITISLNKQNNNNPASNPKTQPDFTISPLPYRTIRTMVIKKPILFMIFCLMQS